MKKLGKLLRDIQTVDYSVKTARFIARMWGLLLFCSVIVTAIVVLLPEERQWGAIAVQVVVTAIAAVMLRYGLMKLARAKNAEWVHSMYEEWSR